LDLEYWLGMGTGPFSPIVLTARLVSREDLFDSLDSPKGYRRKIAGR
jgi:hypothetical protein